MKTILIIGGAGFTGINAAEYFLKKGYNVIIYDNFSRHGSLRNIEWLKNKNLGHVQIISGDIRLSNKSLDKAVAKSDFVLHLAAQVAVTLSVANPREDFGINAIGTFNVFETIRKSTNKPILIYSSTNKVYGEMKHLKITETEKRYQYSDIKGISEKMQLDFHSPYGCSKGCADQYVIDYSRIYDLRTVVLRQSCIYGYHQFGMEDQGWVAWFTIAAHKKIPLTIYGDGKQVRDVLFITDLIRLYDLVFENINITSGKAYNVGGGPDNVLSLLEIVSLLKKFQGNSIDPSYSDWRPGDQKVYISDISKIKNDLGWEPETSVEEGVAKLSNWVSDNLDLF